MSTLASELIAKASEVSDVKGVPFNEALGDVIAHNLKAIATKFNAAEIEQAIDKTDSPEHRDVLSKVLKLMRGKVSIRKEQTMSKDDFVSNMVQIAKFGDVKQFDAWQWDAAVQQRAEEIRKPGEMDAVARNRCRQEDPIGKALYVAYRVAPGPRAKPEEYERPNLRNTSTLKVIDELAEKLIEKGTCKTIEQARARVWQTHPQLVKKYDSERAISLKKQTR